ncbi:apolipoprotein D-like [Cotesia typhae]|uniref:apolipoprotein D-like n=1 Tax=Cotesia typhae TaxID=2053667 RepID=UPI003D69AAB2
MFGNLIFFCLLASAFAQSSASTRSAAFSSASASSSANSGWTNGICPEVVGVPLDMNKKAGYWYEVQRSTNDFFGLDRCVKAVWRKPVNGVSKVINKSFSNVADTIESTVLRVEERGSKIYWTYHVPILGTISPNHVYLDIDYDNHVIVWTCENRGNKHRESALVLSRYPNLPNNIYNAERNAFAKFNLTMPQMVSHDLSNCREIYDSYNFGKDM